MTHFKAFRIGTGAVLGLILVVGGVLKYRGAEPARGQRSNDSEQTRYFIIPDSLNRCGCPNNVIAVDDFDRESLRPIDPKDCEAYLQTALNEIGFNGELKTCQSLELKDPNSGHRLRQVLMSHGPGQDCPSGCIYQQFGMILDESSQRVIRKFEQPYNLIFGYDHGTRVDQQTNLKRLAKAVAYSWISWRDPDVSRIRHGHPVAIHCYVDDAAQVPRFLLAMPNGPFWAAEISDPARCQIGYRDWQAITEFLYEITFSGLALVRDGQNATPDFDLSFLKFKIEYESKVDLTPKPIFDSKLLPPPLPPAPAGP